jgi:hypothetical protein
MQRLKMPNNTNKMNANGAATTVLKPANNNLAAIAGTLASMRFLESQNLKAYLGKDYNKSVVAFSETCNAARNISSEVRKKHALQSLLKAVAEGDEEFAKKIVTSRPELILVSAGTATDLSGREINGLTPLQAAICAGDVDMVSMITAVLQQKLEDRKTLCFDPGIEIHRQVAAIYPDGIDAVDAQQQTKAQEFNNSVLLNILNIINAATEQQVEFELNNPRENNPDSPLNVSLHNFRAQFTTTSNEETIFNPYYLLAALEFYSDQYGADNDTWNRADLFWRQIVGYVQRYLPACYLQAQADDDFPIRETLTRRVFSVEHNPHAQLRLVDGDLDDLGYRWAYNTCGGITRGPRPGGSLEPQTDNSLRINTTRFRNLILTKKSALENLSSLAEAATSSRLSLGQ